MLKLTILKKDLIKMTKYAKVMTSVASAAILVALGGVVSSVKLYSALKVEKAKHSASIAEEQNFTQEELDKKVALEIANAEMEAAAARQKELEGNVENAKIEKKLQIYSVNYEGDDWIKIKFSLPPDMDVVREYVKVDPLNSGAVSYDLDYQLDYDNVSRRWINYPFLIIRGDFAHRQDVTLSVRKGFPINEKKVGRDENTELVPLSEDFTYVFKREDKTPMVNFADKGRYLAPIGDRAIAVKSVNIDKVRAQIREVPNANIVQMLALEEGEYNKIHKGWANSSSQKEEYVADISSEPQIQDFELPNEPNKEQKTALSLKYGDETIKNGVYLVTLMRPGMERDDASYYSKGKNTYRYRVICVSDLALSVRGNDELLVWVTSLTGGNPVGGANVEVYSKANVLIAKGVTDEKGLCRPDRIAAGDVFCVVASASDASDRTFMAVRSSMQIDETYPEGARDEYLKEKETTAFLWSERGIYRHDEKIFLGVILRDGTLKAPEPFPVTLTLKNPQHAPYSSVTILPDENGVINYDQFTVPGSQPSGEWKIEASIPGKDTDKRIVLGSREFKVEEFAPPQIRVKAEAAEGQKPQDFMFTVSAEHLYGGAAKGLVCEGAIVFEDAPFAPADWKGYEFGDESRALKPNYRVLKKDKLDDTGRHSFYAPLFETAGLPAAMVLATAQATAFEDGGRAANARTTSLCHFYNYYIGARISSSVKIPEIGYPEIDIACVNPDGTRVAESKRLEAKLEKIKYIYTYEKNGSDDWASWDCEKVREVVADKISIPNLPTGDTIFALPTRETGDYILTIRDLDSNVSFSHSFCLSAYGEDDSEIKAKLSAPTLVGLTLDKAFYRVGEEPRLLVKAPFAGTALITLMRDKVVYKDVIQLENATSEIILPSVREEFSPSLDVSVSVVQKVKSGANHFAVRSHGECVLAIRPENREIPLSLDAKVELEGSEGGEIVVDISANRESEEPIYAVVTVVDEGINLLTNEKTPNPIAYFAASRSAFIPFFDLYHRLLPVVGDDILRATGIKTGGGFPLALLSRISPQPSRRFKPLALWKQEIQLPGDGTSERVVFKIPEFVGEVRITALAYSKNATGSTSIQKKVTPKIITQGDAPRFVAPGDEFDISLPITNRSGQDQQVEYSIKVTGEANMLSPSEGTINLANNESRVLFFKAKALKMGEAQFVFDVNGGREMHSKHIYLPVRPAVNWQCKAGVDSLKPGESKVYSSSPYSDRSNYSVSASRLGELVSALAWLAEYPHGCLEQTTSRIFPLISAGGILNTLDNSTSSNRLSYVESGVKRVESMIRSNDFVVWPDCYYAPWDREVSLYAAHFLIEAEKSGIVLNKAAKPRVLGFLKNWAKSEKDSVSAYACHTLALAREPDKDRMLVLFDKRDSLDSLSRARLARAFIAINDRFRATTLIESCKDPKSVKEAAFILLAMLELDPKNEKIPSIVLYLTNMRDAKKFEWGTTESNAHALLALGEYYRHAGARVGEKADCRRIDLPDGSIQFVNAGDSDAFISWRRLELPEVSEVKEAGDTLKITRKFYSPEGEELDLTKLQRGDLVIVELTLTSKEKRSYSDLVIEDLFAGAFEPVHGGIDFALYPWLVKGDIDGWVLRSEARDDRMLVYSNHFEAQEGGEAKFHYPLRVVSAGSFTQGAASVEAMYDPSLRANTSSGKVEVKSDAR